MSELRTNLQIANIIFLKSFIASILATPFLFLMMFMKFGCGFSSIFLKALTAFTVIMVFCLSCVLTYPVAKWEERTFVHYSARAGCISWAIHSLFYYSLSLNLLKFIYAYSGTIVTDKTFGMLFMYSIASFAMLFIVNTISDGLS